MDEFRDLLILKPNFQLHQLEEIKKFEIASLLLIFWLVLKEPIDLLTFRITKLHRRAIS